MIGWLVALVLFLALMCVTHHANMLEAERDAACDETDDALEAIRLHRETIAVQRQALDDADASFEHNTRLLRVTLQACEHALIGDRADALALLNEHGRAE